MAGCFGNSMYDRYEEDRLMGYLAQEAVFDSFCEKVGELLPDTQEMTDFFESDKATKILQECFNDSEIELQGCANKIIDSYTEHINNIN